MMAEPSDSILKPLPCEITQQASTSEDRGKFIINFLEKSLPCTDRNGIEEELRKNFVLDKIKSNAMKNKPKKGSYMTSKKRKYLGLKKFLTRDGLKYREVLPLNKLWLEYMKEALGCREFSSLPTSPEDSRWEMVGQKLMRADLHGARVTVIRSKCWSLNEIEGIILQDTQNTFRVIGEDNIIRTITKKIVVLKIHLIGASLTVFGKDLCIRPAERSVKKFKANHIPEL